MSFFKSKTFYILAGVVVVVGLVGWRASVKKNAAPQYETVAVRRGDLVQTVEATGKIKSATDLELKFEVGGLLGNVNVKEGDEVKVGKVLANLRLAELNATVAQAQANLDLKLIGLSDADKQYYQAAVDSAAASLAQAKTDAQSAVNTAQAALDTAQNNLKLAQGGEDSRIVDDAYEAAVATLQVAISAADNGLTQADNILGVDNVLGNDSFEQYLSALDGSKLNYAKVDYLDAKSARDLAKPKVITLTTASDHLATDEAIVSVQDALSKNISLLSAVADVLSATAPVGALTQTILDGYKTVIDATRTSVTTQYTAVITKKQAISTAKNSYYTYQVAYEKAVKDLDAAKANAQSGVALKQAAYDQAKANYDSKINPPREVDVAALRAALSSAVASRNKAIITAPIDGLITKVNKKVGEYVSAADTMIELLSPHYEIEVDIPETDIAKLQLNNVAEITLDAFGQDKKFSGKIIKIEPASTEIQDVVYYKVTVTLDTTQEPIKPGMTANVKIVTAKAGNALSVPSRALIGNGHKTVRILEAGQPKEISVEVGLKADGGKTEILSGLNEGQEVVVSVKTAP